LAETGLFLELLPVGNNAFDANKFFADLLPENDGDGIDVCAASQRFDDLQNVVKKRIHKKRSIGRLRFAAYFI